MDLERRRVTYEGRVRGVGFRMTARRLASGFPVSGYVRNLPDGRVELVAEAEPPALAAFLADIVSEFGDMIREVYEEPEPPGGGDLSGFAIRP